MRNIVEALEGRRLLTSVAWTGAGGDGFFTNAHNWSNDHIPTTGDDVVIADAGALQPHINGPLSLNSLTISNSNVGIGNAIDIAGEYHIEAGASVDMTHATITGTGHILNDVGGKVVAEAFGAAVGADYYVPVENHGVFQIAAGNIFGPSFHNYGTVIAYDGGSYLDCYGTFYNESGALLSINSVATSAAETVSFGLQKSASGVISPAPFLNNGLVATAEYTTFTSGSGLPPPSFYTQSMTLYVDATANIGGSWNASNAPITFKSYSTTSAATVAFDSTFALDSGRLVLSGVNATVRGLPTDAGLTLSSSGSLSTSVTIIQDRLALALLQVQDNATLHVANGGSRVLRAEDLQVASTAKLDIGDNLLIDGNHPGYLQPWISNPPAAATLPAYQASVRGSYNGVPLTVAIGVDPNASANAAVGFSNGAGLAAVTGGHVLDGETFDDNDFVFLATLRGDANFDRTVNFADLARLAQSYNTATSRGYADGNFDNPAVAGNTNFNDLVLLAQNYGQTFSVVQIVAVRAGVPLTKRASVAKDVLS